MQVVIVTPEQTMLDEKCSSMTVPLFDGSYGIMDKHAPMIGRLGSGEMKIKTGSGNLKFEVEGGFVQVADNVVSVLTGKASAVD